MDDPALDHELGFELLLVAALHEEAERLLRDRSEARPRTVPLRPASMPVRRQHPDLGAR
ncbi:hypothetical protein Ssi03_71200 [Sphaerisporangium siamense]|uniref:Uncharacterized protein n=1 Tax=Sphaerisporangium siamense TaxID=795645 RepID=A0A7W7D1Z3_9ACTN|nr:hypothetical protein [Sphaerisporangium siamense]MBB4698792.1 hypothetical protein [Sphaerisporangium siamense]GII89130.1 hypothetical protein Ssi03_71200 [Sphaerisporangium siamense]